jgi:hypothetical protein
MTDERKRILCRIDALTLSPPYMAFHVVHDETNAVWFGKVTYTPWMLINGKPEDRARWDAATVEGATPSEVLRKLADLLE